MKVSIISRKFIKPFSPTPPHLKKLGLSLFDQHMSPIYSNLVFFYPPPNNNAGDIISSTLKRSYLLQKSLSKTLVHFYPMAGEQKAVDSIDCNDKGAYFVEAKISCRLVDFLNKPNPDLLKFFSPTNDPKTTKFALHSNLLIQHSIFECGGMAIALCIWHKLADAYSNYVFMQSWATMSREKRYVKPEFIGESLLPPKDLQLSPTPTLPPKNCTTKRFVFDSTKIASLKDKIGDSLTGQRLPSSVEVVSSFILKYVVAASQSRSGSSRPSLLLQYMNLRKRVVPPMSENAVGNPIWAFEVLLEKNEMELYEIVGKMRKGLTDFCNNKVKKLEGDGGYEVILESVKFRERLSNMDVNTYWCTSLCKMPFYETDFGWGKPVWATFGLPVKNLIILADTNYGGGIEAWVTLDEQDMAIFESNEEVRAFASLNSSPVQT